MTPPGHGSALRLFARAAAHGGPWRVALARLLCAAVVLSSACDPGTPADGGTDAAPLDAGPPADANDLDGAIVEDAAADAAVPVDGGGDAAFALDGGDAGPPTCLCEVVEECTIAGCDGELCVLAPAPDGHPCERGSERVCIDGECAFGVCGDGYRERGPDPAREGCDDGGNDAGDACSPACTPTVLVVASHGFEIASGSPYALAADGRGELLFVWSAESGEDLAIRARRFTAAGVPRDAHDAPRTIRTGLLSGWSARAVVAGLAGGGWAVAWSDPTSDAHQAGIAYRIVRTDGTMTPVRVANEEVRGRQHEPAIAPAGDGFALAWTDESGFVTGLGASRVMIRRFGGAGAPLEAETPLDDGSGSSREPALASSGAALLAAWTSEPADSFSRPRVVARRVGDTLDAAAFVVSDTDGASPDVAALEDGSFACAWVARGADARGDVHARVIARSGAPLLAPSVAIASAPSHAELAPRAGALTGGEYVVTYEDGGLRRGVALVHAGAGALAPESTELATYLMAGLQGDVTMLRTSRGLWLAWSDDGSLGDPLAYRSFLAFLLPHD